MFIENQPADPRIHAAAIRIARRCRFKIQACLREEEWGDADYEFYVVARQEVEKLLAEGDFTAGDDRTGAGSTRHPSPSQIADDRSPLPEPGPSKRRGR